MPHFDIWFEPAEYLAFDHHYAMRTSVDGWDADLDPNDMLYKPHWVLDCDRYAAGLEFKFLIVRDEGDRSEDVWMMGYNLLAVPEPGASYTFTAEHAGPISFPFFIRLLGDGFSAASITLRDQANEWGNRQGWDDGCGVAFAIPWTDYFDSSEGGPTAVRYKFVKDGTLMQGPNLQIGPDQPYEKGERARVGHFYDTDASTVTF